MSIFFILNFNKSKLNKIFLKLNFKNYTFKKILFLIIWIKYKKLLNYLKYSMFQIIKC